MSGALEEYGRLKLSGAAATGTSALAVALSKESNLAISIARVGAGLRASDTLALAFGRASEMSRLVESIVSPFNSVALVAERAPTAFRSESLGIAAHCEAISAIGRWHNPSILGFTEAIKAEFAWTTSLGRVGFSGVAGVWETVSARTDRIGITGIWDEAFKSRWIGETEALTRAFRSIITDIDYSAINGVGLELCEDMQIADAVHAAGWVPHYTTPTEIVKAHFEDGPEVLRECLDDYYKSNWPDVAEAIRDRLRSSGADSETYAGIDEAIKAHTAGLYRATCRTIFPELERAVRLRFYSRLSPRRAITSLVEFREALDNLDVTDIHKMGGWWAFRTYCVFADDCYSQFTPTSAAANDKGLMPNRHAVSHGLATFCEHRQSLNSILLADFCLAALDVLAEESIAA